MKRNKTKVIIRVIAIMLLLCILGISIYLGLLSYAFGWSDWTPIKELSTADGNYSVVLYKSDSMAAMGYHLKIKAICRDNISKKECEYKVFDFSVPDDNNVTWFALKEIDDGAIMIINHSYGQETMKLIWEDIF